MAPPMGFGISPVKDVAAAHCLAMVHGNARGRYICTEGSYTFHDMAAFLKDKYPKQKFPGSWAPPTCLVKIAAPLLGLRRDSVTAYMRKTPLFDNSKIQKELGMRFTPTSTAVQVAPSLASMDEISACCAGWCGTARVLALVIHVFFCHDLASDEGGLLLYLLLAPSSFSNARTPS